MKLHGEAAEQAAVVRWARQNGLLIWSTPNEGDVPAQYRQKQILTGLNPGASDLMILLGPPCMLVALEMKTERGRASHAQGEFIRRVQERGGVGRVCYGRNEAIAWLQSLLASQPNPSGD